MNKTKSTFALLIVFSVGCLSAGESYSFWEYLFNSEKRADFIKSTEEDSSLESLQGYCRMDSNDKKTMLPENSQERSKTLQNLTTIKLTAHNFAWPKKIAATALGLGFALTTVASLTKPLLAKLRGKKTTSWSIKKAALAGTTGLTSLGCFLYARQQKNKFPELPGLLEYRKDIIAHTAF
jgi:hypothetical protein